MFVWPSKQLQYHQSQQAYLTVHVHEHVHVHNGKPLRFIERFPGQSHADIM